LDQLQGHSGGLVQALESHVRGPLTGTAGAFAQQKLDKIDGGDDTPSWDAFEVELQLVYSDKTKEADAEWCCYTASEFSVEDNI